MTGQFSFLFYVTLPFLRMSHSARDILVPFPHPILWALWLIPPSQPKNQKTSNKIYEVNRNKNHLKKNKWQFLRRLNGWRFRKLSNEESSLTISRARNYFYLFRKKHFLLMTLFSHSLFWIAKWNIGIWTVNITKNVWKLKLALTFIQRYKHFWYFFLLF
jgi:hypothetical protein